MASQEIQGKYLLYCFILNASYTLTGADRAGNFGITGAQNEIEVDALSANNQNPAIVCNVENELTIKRIKIEANGGPGIKAGVNHLAAQFQLQLVRKDADNNIVKFDSTQVNIPEWGEWFDLNLVLRPYKRIDGNRNFDFLWFSIVPSTSHFYVDDYNIQADYINQGITPVLYMEVETAGLYIASNGQIF